MSDWITDRLPTEEDAVDGRVLISNQKGEVYTIGWKNVCRIHAWMALPAPYVKPKRWSVWKDAAGWNLGDSNTRYFLPWDCSDGHAQRIADNFNEVLP